MERQQVLEELQRRVNAAGGRVTMTVKSLAEELKEKPERLYYLIRSFEDRGQISTISHGPNGMEFRMGGGVDERATPQRLPGRRRVASSAVGVRRGAAGGGPGASRYCPWCGQAVATDWRYCGACGEQLPKAR